MNNHLLEELQQKGYRAAFVGLERLTELEQEVNVLRRTEVAPEVYSHFLNRLAYAPPQTEDRWESILVVVSPQRTAVLDFVWQGHRVPVEVPPTYILAGQSEVEHCITTAMPDITIRRARLPLKLLAARVGLVRYGRNNVTYAPEMGSFHRLFGYYTTLRVEESAWSEPLLLPSCATCGACIRNCPTGCIEPERFVIRAERCLTTLNELEGDFPDWLPAQSHNALIGCMRCQSVCPENAGVLGWKRHVMSFTGEETEALVAGLPAIEANEELCAKLKSIDLWTGADLLPRNLRAVLTAQGMEIGTS
ncbi:MAG: Epoxyqueuosine reductase [Firmicutes bacterium]|nr:Epoxyqueuosine reductase [candidate division NPL-UPA2 bacterium]